MLNNSASVFAAQQGCKLRLSASTAKERIAKLKRLRSAIKAREQLLYEALRKDLRKNEFEAAVSEVIFIYGEINHAIRHLTGWMKPQRAGKTITNVFAKNRIYSQPKGVCLIISPWNYPFQLLMSPLVSAIAAGNCAILKPSELSPATSAVMAKLIEDCFDREEVCCFEGGADIASELLQLPFDHIFFTGSTTIGKVVMEAAAKNLASVTLELGGKSPVVIHSSADLKKAAEKIAWGKLINAGQTCIAPDYVLIPDHLLEIFTNHYISAVQGMFCTGSGEPDFDLYAKIVSEKHFKRLCELITEATDKGAVLAYGGLADAKASTVSPAVLLRPAPDSRLMQEEIFGPLLPVVPYKNLTEAIALINAKSKPLALYIFSKDAAVTRQIIHDTSSGGICVNDVLVHISNPKLPFGGVGTSGMGSCHGHYGFKAFSHERAVVFQFGPNLTRLIYPPYRSKQWVLNWLRKLV
ncbi:MAG TPA: aldehyde dehydrogenase family protein [Pedobacter sp.]|uniref:aldehyde dehydrogenase family protein n=1 Tax=Pedobacter sp. TaxID=1411316 RepID=UPI002B54483F|nr:aldehyde dehydrogenase family protein [Pedobacter sp.]HMI04923.1 aldehyde dehydrogenase family protein [Pedobacter sp.]